MCGYDCPALLANGKHCPGSIVATHKKMPVNEKKKAKRIAAAAAVVGYTKPVPQQQQKAKEVKVVPSGVAAATAAIMWKAQQGGTVDVDAYKFVPKPMQVAPRAQQQQLQQVLPSAAANNAKMAPDPVVRKRLVPGMEQGAAMKLADQRAIVAQIRAQEIQKQKKAAAPAVKQGPQGPVHEAAARAPAAKLTLGMVARMGGAGSEKSYDLGQDNVSDAGFSMLSEDAPLLDAWASAGLGGDIAAAANFHEQDFPDLGHGSPTPEQLSAAMAAAEHDVAVAAAAATAADPTPAAADPASAAADPEMLGRLAAAMIMAVPEAAAMSFFSVPPYLIAIDPRAAASLGEDPQAMLTNAPYYCLADGSDPAVYANALVAPLPPLEAAEPEGPAPSPPAGAAAPWPAQPQQQQKHWQPVGEAHGSGNGGEEVDEDLDVLLALCGAPAAADGAAPPAAPAAAPPTMTAPLPPAFGNAPSAYSAMPAPLPHPMMMMPPAVTGAGLAADYGYGLRYGAGPSTATAAPWHGPQYGGGGLAAGRQ